MAPLEPSARADAGAVSPVFAGLDAAAQREIASRLFPLIYRPGELIVKNGMPPSGVLIVRQGLVKYGRYVACAGRFRTLRVLGPGEVMGVDALFQGQTRGLDRYARALTDVHARFIQRADLNEFLDAYPEVLRRLCAQLARDLRTYECRLAEWSCDSVKVNMARLLLCLSQRHGEPDAERLRLEVSRRDLADLANVHADTATRVLAELKAEGRIDTLAHAVLVLDPARLAEAAAPLPACLRERAIPCADAAPAHERR